MVVVVAVVVEAVVVMAVVVVDVVVVTVDMEAAVVVAVVVLMAVVVDIDLPLLQQRQLQPFDLISLVPETPPRRPRLPHPSQNAVTSMSTSH